MTWPFENDTSAITKKLAKKSLKKREAPESDGGDCRCAGGISDLSFTGIVSTSRHKCSAIRLSILMRRSGWA